MSPGEKTIPLENHCLEEREWEVTPGVTIRPDDVFRAQGEQFGTMLGSQCGVQMLLQTTAWEEGRMYAWRGPAWSWRRGSQKGVTRS